MKRRMSCTMMLCICLIILSGCVTPVRAEIILIKPEATGKRVDQLKERLYELGYYTTKRYSDTFDEGAEQRVTAFQRINGLPTTGVVNIKTWRALFAQDARSVWRSPIITEATAALYTWPTMPENLPQNLTEEGFLPKGETPYVFAGRDEGYWRYISEDVSIEIRRISESETPLVWFETEIWLAGDQKLYSLMDPTAKKIVMRDPRIIAEEYGEYLRFLMIFMAIEKQGALRMRARLSGTAKRYAT